VGDSADKAMRERIDKHLGAGYFDFILKMGVVAGIPKKKLANELGTTVATVEQIKADYREELGALATHRAICDQVFGSLARVRMIRMQMGLLDRIEDLLTFDGDDSLKPKEKVDLLKFLSSHLNATKPPEQVGSGVEIPPEEFEARLRLLKANE
jgi:hypothetical protein